MTLRYLLDTNIVSYYLRWTSPELENRLNKGLRQYTCATSLITRAGQRYGHALMAKMSPGRPWWPAD